MNREIKFRAFDDGKMITMPLDTHYGIARFFGFLRDDAIIMQFTGLKDKNGKEIYEGSTMKIQLPMGGFWGPVRLEKIGNVRYESDCGGFIVEWEYSMHQHHINLTCDVAFEGEVIGHIYEG